MYEENGRRDNGRPPMPAHWMPMSDGKSFQEILELENSKDQGGTKVLISNSNPFRNCLKIGFATRLVFVLASTKIFHSSPF